MSSDCPDFDSVFDGVEQALTLRLSSLEVTFERAAALYLNAFAQNLLNRCVCVRPVRAGV